MLFVNWPCDILLPPQWCFESIHILFHQRVSLRRSSLIFFGIYMNTYFLNICSYQRTFIQTAGNMPFNPNKQCWDLSSGIKVFCLYIGTERELIWTGRIPAISSKSWRYVTTTKRTLVKQFIIVWCLFFIFFLFVFLRVLYALTDQLFWPCSIEMSEIRKSRSPVGE